MSLFIENRSGKKGTSYRPQVMIKKDGGAIIHREGQTLLARQDAVFGFGEGECSLEGA